MACVDIGETEALECEQLAQPHCIFVGRAADIGGGAPLGADGRALADGEDDVGVAGVDGEQHGSPEEDVAGGNRPHPVSLRAGSARRFRRCLRTRRWPPHSQAGRGSFRPAPPRAQARPRGPARSLARARSHTISRRRSRGGRARPAARAALRPAPRSRSRGIRCLADDAARLMPMPMASRNGTVPRTRRFQQDAGDLAAARRGRRWAI